MSLKSNLLKNGLATGLQKLVLIAQQFVLVPFYLATWGVDYYGQWLTLSAIPTIIGLSNAGLGSAAANTFVIHLAAKEYVKAKNVYRAGFWLITAAILVGIFVSVLLLGILYWHGIFENLAVPAKHAIIAVIFLVGARLVHFYSQLIQAKFLAVRKASLGFHFNTGYNLLKILVSIVLLAYGEKMIAIAVADFLVTTSVIIIMAIASTKFLPDLKDVPSNNVLTEIKPLLKKGFAYFLTPIWHALFFQGSTLVVRTVLGPESVAVFNTVRTLTRSVNQGFSMVDMTIFPEMQFEIAAGRKAKGRTLFLTSFTIVSVFALVALAMLGVLGPYIYSVWTQGRLQPPSVVWWIFIIGILFNAQWWTAGSVFRAVNKPEGIAAAGVIGAAFSVVLSWVLTNYYGLTGAALGTLVLEITMLIYALPNACKIVEQDITSIHRDGLKELLLNFKWIRAKALNKIKV